MAKKNQEIDILKCRKINDIRKNFKTPAQFKAFVEEYKSRYWNLDPKDPSLIPDIDDLKNEIGIWVGG